MKRIYETTKRIGRSALVGGLLLALSSCGIGDSTKVPTRHIGEYKGYVLSNPEIYDTDGDGKIDVMVNPPRDSIPDLDFYLKARDLKYKRAFVKEGHLAQYAGEDVELVPKDFFDDMFPIREDPNKK